MKAAFVNVTFRIAALTILLGFANICPSVAAAQASPPGSSGNGGQTPAVAVDPAVYEGYVGHYRFSETTVMTVSRNGTHLLTQMTGQPVVVEIFPTGRTEFSARLVNAQITFQTDASGRATALTLHQNGREITAPRISDQAAKQIEDALNARLHSKTPQPGSEAALRQVFAGLLSGKPNYGQMAPGIAALTRQQLTQLHQLATRFGPIESVRFLNVAPNGADVFEVHHEHSVVSWQIALAPDGKVSGVGFVPPPGTVASAQASGPKGEPGPYRTVSEPAFGSPGLVTFRPESLEQFPRHDRLPVVVWGNGGCTFDTPVYASFLRTIASHGFLVISTGGAPKDGGPGHQVTADDLEAAIDWAERENSRPGSSLNGKIETRRVAVMGQSCGGELALELGADPRVQTIGVFDFGSTDTILGKLHGPVLLINGGQPDFMMSASKSTYDAIANLPVFYGSLHGAGHAGTVMQPGGGEFATVASNWLLWQFKGDKKAKAMFVGAKCRLCTNPNWDVGSKRLTG